MQILTFIIDLPRRHLICINLFDFQGMTMSYQLSTVSQASNSNKNSNIMLHNKFKLFILVFCLPANSAASLVNRNQFCGAAKSALKIDYSATK